MRHAEGDTQPPEFTMEQELPHSFGQHPVSVEARRTETDNSLYGAAVVRLAAEAEALAQDSEERDAELSPAQTGYLALQAINRRIIKPSAREPVAKVPEDTFDLYFRGMAGTELLKAEEEPVLGKQIEYGYAAEEKLTAKGKYREQDAAELELQQWNGQYAKDIFVRANLRLVINLAKDYNRHGNKSDLADLTQCGNIGLLRAVDKFDWRRGNKFSTYATWWIKQSIQRGISGFEDDIRLPEAVHRKRNKVRAVTHRLRNEIDDREPTVVEIAEEAKLTEADVAHIHAHSYAITSLDKSVGSDNDSASLGNFIADPGMNTAEQAVGNVATQENGGAIQNAMRSALDEREIAVLTRRFGLDGEDVSTLEECGKMLGLSRESIRQLEYSSRAKLARVLDRSQFEDLL